jgi:hypothetical protein
MTFALTLSPTPLKLTAATSAMTDRPSSQVEAGGQVGSKNSRSGRGRSDSGAHDRKHDDGRDEMDAEFFVRIEGVAALGYLVTSSRLKAVIRETPNATTKGSQTMPPTSFAT